MGLLNNAPFLQLPSPLKNVQFHQEETRNDHKGPLFAPPLTQVRPWTGKSARPTDKRCSQRQIYSTSIQTDTVGYKRIQFEADLNDFLGSVHQTAFGY